MPRKPKFDVYATARTVIEEILKLKDDPEQVKKIPAIFAALNIKPMERYSVFQLLDEKPGYFGSTYWEWHAPLRQCRNWPEVGKKMFATFNG